MKLKKYDLILGFLILFEIILCIYVGYSGNNNYLCTIGSSCSNVQNSVYGTLFGIKLAWFGVFSFSIFFLLFLIARFTKRYYWIFFLATMAGTILAIYFISLQVFVLKEICRECIFIDLIMVLMLIIVVFEFIDFRKEVKALERKVERTLSKNL